jgi:hypothetical protein
MSSDFTPPEERHAPGLRLHPRTMPVQKAEGHFKRYVHEFQDEYDLTDIEMLRALIDAQQSITKYMLRAERHPDNPDQKADEA